ncbi:MAG: hypothetical protein WA190_17655 [Usitatibacter sp.]
MPVDLVTGIQTVHGALVVATATTYFSYFSKFEGTTGDLDKADLILAALANEVNVELKDRLRPLFAPGAPQSKILDVTGAAPYKEAPGDVVDSEEFTEAVRAFAASHSGHLFKYGLVLELRERIVHWRQNAAWCALMLFIWEVAALPGVFGLSREWPTHAEQIHLYSLAPTVALLACGLFSLIVIQAKNDRLASIRTGLTSLPG